MTHQSCSLHSSVSSLKKGVCRRRAALDTFQHNTTLSLMTRNQPMNFAMLPKYYIGKCRYTVYQQYLLPLINGVIANPSCYFIYD